MDSTKVIRFRWIEIQDCMLNPHEIVSIEMNTSPDLSRQLSYEIKVKFSRIEGRTFYYDTEDQMRDEYLDLHYKLGYKIMDNLINHTVDFAIALNHLKAGGSIRRKCWGNNCSVAFWKSHPTLDEEICYMPDESSESWATFEGFDTDDLMADDWELTSGEIE